MLVLESMRFMISKNINHKLDSQLPMSVLSFFSFSHGIYGCTGHPLLSITLGHCPLPRLVYIQGVFDVATVWPYPGCQDSSVSIFNVTDFFT